MRTSTILTAALPIHQSCPAYVSPCVSSAIINQHDGSRIRRRNRRRSYSAAFSKKNDDNDDEEWLQADAPIDFSDLEQKILDNDAANMGWIRAREPRTNRQAFDLPTDKEMELFMKRTKMVQREERKRIFVDKWFSWLSPLMTFFVPKKFSTSSRVADKYVCRNILSGSSSGRNLLVLLNIIAYMYQIFTAVQYLPGFNRMLASSVTGNTISAASLSGTVPQWSRSEVILRALGIVGSGVVISSRRGIAAHSMGPFFIDFAHQPYPLSYYQKHRYLTSGFLHGSLLHLGMNIRALLSLPNWLENGIGKGVYLSAYLVSIVTGNIAHSFSTLGDLPGRASSALCIGASGGICGLYGLMFASLWRMSNSKAAMHVFKQMLWLVAFGYLVPNVSNAAHVGGFLGGCLVGYLFGPGYSMSRGRGMDYADPEFRSVMGSGKYPNADRSLIPLRYLWTGLVAAMLIQPDFRVIPMAVLKGILEPGSLSNVRSLLL